MRYYIEHLPMTIPMGVQSENNAEAVEFDVSDWLARDGSLSFSVWVTRPGETEAYQADNATLKDGVLSWWPTGADTAIAGEGKVEILAVSANRRMLSGWTATAIRETTTETTTDAPVDQRPGLDQALLASEEAKAAATSAAASADQAEGVVKKEIAALTEEIDRNTAPPIIPTATGEVVTVSDSAHRPLAGLRLYGKTTQDGVPSPNNRVPMVNAGDGGNIETIITAKNRFDFDSWKASCVPTRANVEFGVESVTITAVEDDAFVVSETMVPVVGGKTYTISYNVSDDSIFKTNHLFKNGIVDDSMRIHHGTKYTFVADADAQFYTVRFGIPDAGNTVTFSNIMFVEGVDILPYEPGAPMQTINVSTPNGLRGNPVPTGGTYTDETGKQWVCDEVDLGRGVRVQRISRVVGNDANAVFVQPGMWYLNGIIANTTGGRLGVLASHYKAYSTNEAQHGNVCVNRLGMIVFGNEAYTDEATMKADLAQNPVTVDYILTSPIETPLTDDELAAFRAMTSNKPSTVVYNNAGAVLGVDYVADTKNYIDQKLAAIAAATL